MSGVVKINIKESAAELKRLLSKQKSKRGFERVQALYLLKTGQVDTVQHLAVVIGCHRTTIQGWLREYRLGGLTLLLEERVRPGRPSMIPQWAIESLKEELSQPEGFSSYGEVRTWLSAGWGIRVKYDVVHNLVHNKLKSRLKVARPKSSQQEPGAIETFKQELKKN